MSQRANHPARNAVVALAAAGMGVATVFGAGASAVAAEAQAPLAMDTAAAVAAQAQAQAQAAAKAAQTKAVKAAAVKAIAQKPAVTKKATKAVGWIKPVTGYTLTASFNQGGSMWSHKHSGQDFAVPVGTPVKAAHGGTVVKAGPNGGGDGPAYGNAIVIKHSNGTYSQYAHLSKINVSIGSKVKTGQLIARSGNTGNSSGPHLHFEIRTTPNYGSAVNPAAFLRAEGVVI
ncbi:M23 family metallopeptidase [Streptomyces sp. TRM76323]|uniref:M23 family metallopeptidase n=1 Tax=Streptomyces tamarix TaxID=3078565 RepID=A0ABU3QEV9_9ACTN|nr:M23 family metallopeptidase [Streptomyces tamarix]MDT9680902.1 M23 family metallopeptidase [Streptomyces tamarix]